MISSILYLLTIKLFIYEETFLLLLLSILTVLGVNAQLTVTEYNLDKNGGTITFSQNVRFKQNANTVACNVTNMVTRNIETQAYLYNSDGDNIVKVSFTDILGNGEYTLDIEANVIVAANFIGLPKYEGGNLTFKVESEEEEPVDDHIITPSHNVFTMPGETSGWAEYDIQFTAPATGVLTLVSSSNFGVKYAGGEYMADYDSEDMYLPFSLNWNIIGGETYNWTMYMYVGDVVTFNFPESTTGLQQVNANAAQSGKALVNGQLVIVKNGVKYNAAGAVIK